VRTQQRPFETSRLAHGRLRIAADTRPRSSGSAELIGWDKRRTPATTVAADFTHIA
jgi:hypothetical protein